MKVRDKLWWLGVGVGIILVLGMNKSIRMGKWKRWTVYPAMKEVELVDKGLLYLIDQRDLILENEKWREKYAKVVANCGIEKAKEDKQVKLNIDPSKYKWVEGKIVLIRGPSLEVETYQKLKAQEGIVILKGWVIGRWIKKSEYEAEVLLWFLGGTWERVEIIDDKGNFIGNGVLRVDKGKVTVGKILRGLKLRGGEGVRLLSGRYEKMPMIGLLKIKKGEDNVYQEWQLDVDWKRNIRLGERVYLVYNAD